MLKCSKVVRTYLDLILAAFGSVWKTVGKFQKLLAGDVFKNLGHDEMRISCI